MDDNNKPIELVTDTEVLLRYGIVSKIPIINDDNNSLLSELEWKRWVKELTQITPVIITDQGDNEYAFYRNILTEEELDFPYDSILKSAVGKAILKYFPILSLSEIRLDDAFCIHYNMDQYDTTGAKHMDPSDITVNICIEKSNDCIGSYVLFHGMKQLQNVKSTSNDDIDHDHDDNKNNKKFLVNQEYGYATIHWGNHPHETTKLIKGQRTNIILTFCYIDESRSDVTTRSCYNV